MRIDHAREIRERLSDPGFLIQQLGLEEGAKRQQRGLMILCPVHAEHTPSCSVRIGDDGTVAIRCHGCGWTGDALGLVAKVRGIDKDREFRRLLEAAASLCGYVLDDAPKTNTAAPAPPRPMPPPRTRAPLVELQTLWDACMGVTTDDEGVDIFLASRRLPAPALERLDVLRVTPLVYGWPPWWPSRWSNTWRLITRAYEPDGTLASLHARAVTDETPKTRWPYDCRADGLVFADRLGLELLHGRAEDFDRILVVEGITDLAAAALWAGGSRVAVIGMTSGSAAAFGAIRWPSGVRVFIGTDADAAGERYAAAVESSIPKRIPVSRWKNPRAA